MKGSGAYGCWMWFWEVGRDGWMARWEVPSSSQAVGLGCARGRDGRAQPVCYDQATRDRLRSVRTVQVYENGAQGRMRYGDVVRDMYRRGGLRSFYRGIALEYSKVLPGMAIAFTTYEALKQLTGATAAAQ